MYHKRQQKRGPNAPAPVHTVRKIFSMRLRTFCRPLCQSFCRSFCALFYANFTAVFSAISIISVKLSWRSCAERATGLKR